jgi:hypothetical protein
MIVLNTSFLTCLDPSAIVNLYQPSELNVVNILGNKSVSMVSI